MNRDLSRAICFVAFALLVASLNMGSTCGSSSNDAAVVAAAPPAPQPAPTPEAYAPQIHTSTTGGTVTTPVSLGLIRSITFTPDSPEDVVVYVQAFGVYDCTAVSAWPTLEIRIKDAVGNTITQYTKTYNSGDMSVGAGQFYFVQTAVSGADISGTGSFPSVSYTIELWATGWMGDITTTNFKVFVAPGFVEEVPSDNFS